MTNKKNNNTDETKTNSKNNSKRILYELVNESEIEEHKIMGALAKAGLLNQFETEKEKYPRFKIQPTLSQAEFDKILKDFL